MIDKNEVEWSFLFKEILRGWSCLSMDLNFMSKTSMLVNSFGYLSIVFVNLNGVYHTSLPVLNFIGKNESRVTAITSNFQDFLDIFVEGFLFNDFALFWA